MQRKLHITPVMVEAAYELLRLTPPFRAWKLPHADDVEFHVTRHLDRHGDCLDDCIRISATFNKTLNDLIMTLAHEMCHMRQDQIRPNKPPHGAYYRKLRRSVCRYHGFEEHDF